MFVFHIEDPALDCIQGIKDSYQVSLKLSHGHNTLYHWKSFLSFSYQLPLSS